MPSRNEMQTNTERLSVSTLKMDSSMVLTVVVKPPKFCMALGMRRF